MNPNPIHTQVDITEGATSDLAADAVLVTDTQILCMMSALTVHLKKTPTRIEDEGFRIPRWGIVDDCIEGRGRENRG